VIVSFLQPRIVQYHNSKENDERSSSPKEEKKNILSLAYGLGLAQP
jgi:hypothetical protein